MKFIVFYIKIEVSNPINAYTSDNLNEYKKYIKDMQRVMKHFRNKQKCECKLSFLINRCCLCYHLFLPFTLFWIKIHKSLIALSTLSDTNFKCNGIFCNATFKSHQSFRWHLCSTHNCVVTTREQKRRQKSGKTTLSEVSDSRILYECPSCPSNFDDQSDLKNHVLGLHVIK